MGHREIALIICGCIMFISVTTILIKYFVEHKKKNPSNQDEDHKE